MERGHLIMSRKERERLRICGRIKEGGLKLSEWSNQLRLSYRQMLRVYGRFMQEGDAGLIHRSRGRSSNRVKGIRDEVIDLYREKYLGFGPTLASEKFEEAGYLVDHETVRLWLIQEGQWKRQRKRGPHRQWRERKRRFGELIQMDGSHHCWFEGDLQKYCLMVMVDDATGVSLSRFSHEETTEAAMRLLWAWIDLYGVPKALYTDRKNLYVTDRPATIEEQLAGEEPLTVFGKSCQRLGIGIIKAYSPQAKGRVERKNGVYQDRLVKELKLQGIGEIDAANRFLREGFEADLNRKFAVPPADEQDAHRPLSKELHLRDVFCFEEDRRVNNDWTVQYQGRLFQIRKENKVFPRTGQRVIIRRDLEGKLTLSYKGQKIAYDAIETRPQRLEPDTKKKSHLVHRPGPDHPWRKPFTGTRELKEATV